MSETTGDLISRIYTSFRGVDFRGEEISLVRSPDALNVWRDYRKTASIETRPGMALATSFDDTVYGIYFYKNMMIVHSGVNLYKVVDGETSSLYTGLNAAASDAFTYENVWYFKDGKNYLRYDGETVGAVAGYVPTTSIARKAAGGGTIHEDVNFLTGRRINTFLGDGESVDFCLDAKEIDADFTPIVTVNGVETSDFTVDFAEGKITFKEAPEAPLTDGQDNVSVEFKKTIVGYSERILGCNMLQVFDNRVFVSGNKDYPNTVWHCSLNDPTYFSDLDYYREGLDEARVMGMVAGNNALWVFREPSQANTTVFYHTPTIDGEYGKIYPSQHSSVTAGCVGKAINFNDDIVFFSDRGMEGISGDITTEQAVAHRSSLVDRKLLSEVSYGNMVLEEWEGYLMVFVGDKVFLADSRSVLSNESHTEYEWFYWELDKKVTCAKVYGGVLYLGTEDGVYTLTDTEKAVESYWVTPKDKFKAPHLLKTTNKRGCVVEAEGDISVYAKVEDTGFELIGSYQGVTDYFACRIKRKKWKDIQLKFYSKSRFRLESATLEAFLGGYIKR